jgi:hypothetical protein
MSPFTALPIAVSIAAFGLVIMAVITGVRRGWDPDVTGSRSRAMYIYGVGFVALVIAGFTISALVSAIVRIILPEHLITVTAPGLLTAGDLGDKEATNEAVLAGLLAVAALLVFLLQYRRGTDALGEPGWLESQGGRIRRGYLFMVSFVAILVALFAGAVAAYGVYEIALPGTAGLGAPHDAVRDAGIVQVTSLGVLTLLALAVFGMHWRQVRPRRATVAAPPHTAPAAPTPAPPSHAPPTLPTPPPPAPHPPPPSE